MSNTFIDTVFTRQIQILLYFINTKRKQTLRKIYQADFLFESANTFSYFQVLNVENMPFIGNFNFSKREEKLRIKLYIWLEIRIFHLLQTTKCSWIEILCKNKNKNGNGNKNEIKIFIENESNEIICSIFSICFVMPFIAQFFINPNIPEVIKRYKTTNLLLPFSSFLPFTSAKHMNIYTWKTETSDSRSETSGLSPSRNTTHVKV